MFSTVMLLASALAVVAGQDGYGSGPQAPPMEAPAPRLAPPDQAPIAVVPGRALKDVPNLSIKYYDVTGKDMAAISRSIAKQRPQDPTTKQPLVGGANWTLGATMTRRTSDGQCTVTAAKADFTATAELPRLANEQLVRPEVLTTWRAYVAQLEGTAAASLWFVRDRIPAFEQALVGKECGAAAKAGSAAIEQLRNDYAEFQRTHGATTRPTQ